MQYKWHYVPSGNKGNKRFIPYNVKAGFMSRFILDNPNGKIYYIDNDQHNLRKNNLKVIYKNTTSILDMLRHVYYSEKHKVYFVYIVSLGACVMCSGFRTVKEAVWFRNALYELLDMKDPKPEISRELISQLTEEELLGLQERLQRKKHYYMPKIKKILKLRLKRAKKRRKEALLKKYPVIENENVEGD